MSAKIFIGYLLVAGLLLTGTAWAEGNAAGGAGTQDALQSSVAVDKSTPGEALTAAPGVKEASENGVKNKDVFQAYDETIPKAEVKPESEAPSNGVSTGESVKTPEAETPPEVEDAPGEAGTDEAVEDTTIADPIEPLNRAMFHFNDKLYFWALKPFAKGYNWVVPEPVRVSVRDFFRNAAMPVRFVSSLFQGKLKGAGTELARFGINSTLGLAGFFDVAKSWFDLDASEEDLGQTLGSYGMGGGMYIVWPFLGPSTIRDTIGFVGDSFLDVANYVNPFYIPLSIHAYDRINKTSLDLQTYDDLVESSLEPYTAVRDAYIQNRNGLIKK